MSRPKNPIPTYSLHKPSGQARVRITTGDGDRREIFLGPYNSPESKKEYERIIAQLRVAPESVAAKPEAARGGSSSTRGMTVDEVLVEFLRYANRHYVHPDGSLTSEAENYPGSVRELSALYGSLPADEFGPLGLKAVRQQMVERGLCRRETNSRVNRIRRVFKWATSEELIKFETYHRLTTVQALARGRTAAKDYDPVGPVSDEHVEATLERLSPMVRVMVQVQRLTGMRPNEICGLKRSELDRSGPVWLFRPPHHKTSYAGKARVVPIGPKAQALLADWIDCETDHLFSPVRNREQRYAVMRAKRKTKVQPSQTCRKSPKPKRRLKDVYDVRAYGHAIRGAAIRAGVPVWGPNRLRHSFATEVRKHHGLEAAQVLLGHSQANVTQIYAERDLNLAVTVAAAVG